MLINVYEDSAQLRATSLSTDGFYTLVVY